MEKLITIVSDLLKTDRQGKPIITKTNVERLRRCRVSDIEFIDQSITQKGTVEKKYCLIKMFGEWYKIKHSFEETKGWMDNTPIEDTKIGFNYGGKQAPGKSRNKR